MKEPAEAVGKERLRALVVEPDDEYAALAEAVLSRAGVEAVRAAAEDALEVARAGGVAVGVVDAELVLGSGRSLLRELREGASLPLVALSSADVGEEVVRRAMEHADYELVRPFSPRRLRAAVRAVVRRGRVTRAAGAGGEPQSGLVVGRLALDSGRLEARVDGMVVGLSPREFSLLYALASSPGVATTRDELAARAWGWQVAGDSRAVDNVVLRLRQKLGDGGTRPRFIATERGVGYRMVVP